MTIIIFRAKNERGEPSWKLAKEGKKTVTRRLKPMEVGKIFAIQPGRGKKAVCHGKAISCMDCAIWYEQEITKNCNEHLLDEEAKKEGFETWEGLINWLVLKYGEILPDFYRIEFKIVKEKVMHK